jgi:hypothetical protein
MAMPAQVTSCIIYEGVNENAGKTFLQNVHDLAGLLCFGVDFVSLDSLLRILPLARIPQYPLTPPPTAAKSVHEAWEQAVCNLARTHDEEHLASQRWFLNDARRTGFGVPMSLPAPDGTGAVRQIHFLQVVFAATKSFLLAHAQSPDQRTRLEAVDWVTLGDDIRNNWAKCIKHELSQVNTLKRKLELILRDTKDPTAFCDWKKPRHV